MTENIRDAINDTLFEGNGRVPYAELVREVSRHARIDRGEVTETIRAMVANGQLAYACMSGTSFLMPSFDRPVRVSKRIVLKPPEKTFAPAAGDLVVDIRPGAAFGTGAHPTTCLVLKSLDRLLNELAQGCSSVPSVGLDIGTGSGVLAITLARLGVPEVWATDVDPCAVSEARQNVTLNGLEGRIKVTDSGFSRLGVQFSIVLANLAGPTLQDLAPAIGEATTPAGVIVLSGFKEDGVASLAKTYGDQCFRLIREETLQDWACMVLRKAQYLSKQ